MTSMSIDISLCTANCQIGLNTVAFKVLLRDQLNGTPKPLPRLSTIALGVLRSLYRFHSGHPLPAGSYRFQRS